MPNQRKCNFKSGFSECQRFNYLFKRQILYTFYISDAAFCLLLVNIFVYKPNTPISISKMIQGYFLEFYL